MSETLLTDFLGSTFSGTQGTFGTQELYGAFAGRGIEIEVINQTDNNEENLIEDFVSVITSFCARIYGKRRSKRKTEEIIKALKC